ncbi:MAG TPA: cysteine--tRNA ligase [Nevskiaceae bacterium]|nr:cysteine--tRNA ligase [Nevskiaceae bacterium]
MYLHNTATGRKEVFEPADPQRVTMYVCGPTVYSYAHIGNARPAVVFDVLARLLRRLYPQLVYTRNITDIDDKINARAAHEGVPIGVIADRYAAAYHADLEALGVAPPDFEPRVTQHIPQIIEMIAALIAAGHAYAAERHVLFHVPSFAAYGELSKRDPRELLAGARVEVAPFKKNSGDFVLWKPSTDDQPGWDSPWGRGRPGWHIECSAMAAAHLGETIDIHGGGHDLIFPHHENERAQSVCAHGGKTFARYWVHNGFLTMDHAKMAKSVGNVLLLHDLLQAAPGEAVRLALLTGHYRQPLNWEADTLPDARKKLDRLYGALRDAGPLPSSNATAPDRFLEALGDDLNTPAALAELFELARTLNKAEDAADKARLVAQLRDAGHLLGLLTQTPEQWFEAQGASDTALPTEAEIATQIEARAAAKRAKNYTEADRIRDALKARGVLIEDSAQGTRWRHAE